MVCRVTRSKVKITKVRTSKVAKMASQSPASTGMHVMKRLVVNYDTPRQYLNFNRTFKLSVFHLSHTNFAC